MILRVFVVLSVLGMASTVAAQEDEMSAGEAARSIGDHATALAHFGIAWDRDASPIARAEMGIEELALGRFAPAEGHLTEALALAAGTTLEARRAELEAALREAARHLGSVDVRCAPGCVVTVDGDPIGVTPLGHLVRLEAGTHAVVATLADHEPASAEIVIAAGDATRVDLSPDLIDRRPILERLGRDAFQTIGVTGLSLGGAGLIVGGVMLGLAIDRAGTPEGTDYRTAAIVSLIVGSVLTAVGAVFLAIAPEESPSLACAPAYELGVSCIANF